MLSSLSTPLIMLSASRYSEIRVLGFQLYAFPNFPFVRVLEKYLQHSESGLMLWFLFPGTVWRWFCQRGGADSGWGGCCQRIGRVQRSGQVRMDKGGSGASFHNKFSHLCSSIRSLWNPVHLYTNSLLFFPKFHFLPFNFWEFFFLHLLLFIFLPKREFFNCKWLKCSQINELKLFEVTLTTLLLNTFIKKCYNVNLHITAYGL